jgi:hypothetical protein
MIFFASIISLGLAASPNLSDCFDASEKAQKLKEANDLLGAKQMLPACLLASCPALVRKDCGLLAEQINAAIPSIIVAVTEGEGDVSECSVSIDKIDVLKKLSGSSVELNPGEHMIEIDASGKQQTKKIVANVGEKNRRIAFVLPLQNATVTATPTDTKMKSDVFVNTNQQPQLAEPAKPVVPFLLSGAALVGFGVFTGLGLHGNSQLANLQAQPCAQTKTCSPSKVEEAKTSYLGANIGLGVGVVFAALATWSWVSWANNSPVQAVSVSIDSSTGAAVSVKGSF